MARALAKFHQTKHRVGNAIYLWQKSLGHNQDPKWRSAYGGDHGLKVNSVHD
jgi:hypothetical protein